MEVQWRHVSCWCVCVKVAGGGTVEACVVLVCVYKGGRWRYSGGMCRAGVCVCVCVCIKVAAGSTAEACVVLVTGPNMGGKSTLMRQVGCIIILAQLVSVTVCHLENTTGWSKNTIDIGFS